MIGGIDLTNMHKFVAWGAIAMLLAVGIGAFGAHGLESRLDSGMMSAYETGVHYHIAHALGLLLIGIAADKARDSKKLRMAGYFLTAGIVLFSGSLYVMAITGIGILGAITPFGGVSFMIGWGFLAAAALQKAI